MELKVAVAGAVSGSGGLGWDQKGVFLSAGAKFNGVSGTIKFEMGFGVATKEFAWNWMPGGDWGPTPPWYLPGMSDE